MLLYEHRQYEQDVTLAILVIVAVFGLVTLLITGTHYFLRVYADPVKCPPVNMTVALNSDKPALPNNNSFLP